jgi:hypothetical protein
MVVLVVHQVLILVLVVAVELMQQERLELEVHRVVAAMAQRHQ